MNSPTRVAELYLTEYDRFLRTSYFRNTAAKDDDDEGAAKAIFLEKTDA